MVVLSVSVFDIPPVLVLLNHDYERSPKPFVLLLNEQPVSNLY